MNLQRFISVCYFEHRMQIIPSIALCYYCDTEDHTVCLYSIDRTGAQHSLAYGLCSVLHHAHVSSCHLDSRMSSCSGGLMR